MKEKETRWYILWFFASGMWLGTFYMTISSKNTFDWIVVLQFFNIIISFFAGIINARRYKQRQDMEEKDN